MKRIGLIDNLSNIDEFVSSRFAQATAADTMTATGGNTGNVGFVFGARRILANPITRVGWGWSPEVVRARFDQLVVCCANQVGAHADLGGWSARLAAFGLPVTLLGLGAQSDDVATFPSVPAGTVTFLSTVRAHRPDQSVANISVRGAFTRDVLNSLGSESVANGCPSLLISNDPELGVSILRRSRELDGRPRVAVAAGNPWHGPSSSLEPKLVDIVDRYHGEYVLQHPESMIQIAFGERDSISDSAIARFLEVYAGRFDESSMFSWYRRFGVVFADAPNWMRFLARFDRVIGPRYHGVALAIQAGTPGCVIEIDSRTEDLCEGTSVKSMSLKRAIEMSSDDIVEASIWADQDATRLDSKRQQNAASYVDFLRGNELEPSAHLLALAHRGR